MSLSQEMIKYKIDDDAAAAVFAVVVVHEVMSESVQMCVKR